MGLTILTYFLIVVEVIASALLLAVILIQKSKSQGMGLAFGSAMGESLFGSQVGNVLTRTTVILAVIFLVNTTLLAMIGSSGRRRSASVVERTPLEAPARAAQAPMAGPGEAPAPQQEMPMFPVTESAAPSAGVTPVEVPAIPAPQAAPVEVAPVEAAPVEAAQPPAAE